jgi:hypothetical protein
MDSPAILTKEDFIELCKKWQKRLHVKANRIQIRKMRRKWSSCTSNGTITLNNDLIKLPRDVVEYAVVHELLHLIVPNHGRTFKTLLYVHLPKWEEHHEQLLHAGKSLGFDKNKRF